MDSIIKTKKVPDYSLGKIYKITSPNCDEVYIGSTTRPLNDRFSRHKYDCNIKNCSSKIVIDCCDAVIELIEDFPCKSRKELERREGEVIRSTENCCNKTIAGRTQQEYYIDHSTELLEKARQYYIDNSTEKLQYQKQYGIDHTTEILEKKRNYYIKNKDKICDKKRQYYLKQKAKLNLIA